MYLFHTCSTRFFFLPYGDRITENRFKKLGRGYAAGAQDTVYNSEDLVVKPLGSDKEESVDLFAEDDDDMDLFN